MTLERGARLGPYEIESLLGSGGFGAVYKAHDTRLGRTVALKVLLPVIADDAKFRERFEREARVISQLTHPNICTLYDVGHDHGTEFLVMEFLEGTTLAERIGQSGLPIDEALNTARQIADALVCAHGAGIMHRDLKPRMCSSPGPASSFSTSAWQRPLRRRSWGTAPLTRCPTT